VLKVVLVYFSAS